MTRQEYDKQVSDLVTALDSIATQRKEGFDRLWLLENEAQELRNKLVKLVKEGPPK